jgi:ferrous iron transport protein A
MRYLAQIPRNTPVVIRSVSGPRAFRRRLMEMGLVPGTEVAVVNVAPLGDPLEIEARACRLSIRRAEAAEIEVVPVEAAAAVRPERAA